MKNQSKKVYENAIPVRIDKKGREDSEMLAWLNGNLGDRTQVRPLGVIVDDGRGICMYQAVGENASALSTNFAKKFWSARKRKGYVLTVYENVTWKLE